MRDLCGHCLHTPHQLFLQYDRSRPYTSVIAHVFLTMANKVMLVITFFAFISRGLCWSQDELDIFDLVEEIGENFYDLLEVQKDCSTADIRKSYRRLSLRYHPDKNSDPNAAEIFTKLGAVAEVLRDEQKRAMYDSVLEHGLPDWKQPVYYYRRVRKMGMLELFGLLLGVLTVGQLLYGWAAYLEKQIVLYELRSKRDEKVKKSKGKKTHQQLEVEVAYYELLAQSYLPSWRRLLPVLLFGKLLYLAKALILSVFVYFASFRKTKPDSLSEEEKLELEKKEQEREKREKVEKERMKEEEEKTRIKSEKKLRKLEQTLKTTRMKNELRDQEDRKLVMSSLENEEMETKLKEIELEYEDSEFDSSSTVKLSKGGKKRIKKGRKIADLNDTISSAPPVVIADSNHNNTDQTDPINDDGCGNGWSQYQQKQLEWALAHYTKDTEERWEKIAMAIPGKSKADCLGRYKELVKLVQSKRKDEM